MLRVFISSAHRDIVVMLKIQNLVKLKCNTLSNKTDPMECVARRSATDTVHGHI